MNFDLNSVVIHLYQLLIDRYCSLSVMDLQELARVLPKHSTNWTVDDVLRWLDYISLSQLAPTFKSNRIEGWQLLLTTEDDLVHKLKIPSNIHRKKLLNWIAFLVDNSRLLHSIVTNLTWEEPTQEEEPADQNIQTNSHFEKQLSTTEDTANQEWGQKGQLGSTQKIGAKQSKHLNLYVYERFGGQNRYFSCDGGRNLTIGKGAGSTICIIDPSIQIHHCSIIHRQQNHYLKPNSSAISGVWIKISKSIPIQRTYVLQMGFTQFIVTVQQCSLTLRVIQNQEPMSCNGCYSYPPSQKVVRIGRSLKQELSFNYDPTMSSLHGKFSFIDGLWYFEDMYTTNGSWFRCREEELITDKMTFRVGRTIYNFDCRLLQNQDLKSVSSIQSRGICKLCKSAQKNSYFSPCAHSNSCMQCAIRSSRCIQCNKSISSVHKIYRQ